MRPAAAARPSVAEQVAARHAARRPAGERAHLLIQRLHHRHMVLGLTERHAGRLFRRRQVAESRRRKLASAYAAQLRDLDHASGYDRRTGGYYTGD